MKERKKYLIVVAAGSGKRMGGKLPKQYLQLEGKTVLQRSIEAFSRTIPGLKVVTVLAPEMKEHWKQCCYDAHFDCSQSLVAGGLTRFHSIRNALECIPDDAVVAVHDGVRPLVSPRMVLRLFNLAEQFDGVVPCLPMTDTLRILSPAGDARTAPVAESQSLFVFDASAPALVSRDRLFSIQTPQIFDAPLLKAAYRLPFETCFTDDGSVVEKYLAGHPESPARIVYAPGEKTNIKLTTPEDLTLARAILALPEGDMQA